MQQGDILLEQTDNEGEITITGGLVAMSGGLATTAYLSLFGGNEDDDGRAGSPHIWWANLSETDPAFQYRSETQNLLEALPATTGNLRRVEDAASRDLAWLVDKGAASAVTVTASLPGINRVKLVVEIVAIGIESRFEFVENWKARS